MTEEVMIKLGQLEAKIDGINDRLDRINGSVARHEDCINKSSVERAVIEEKIKDIPNIQKTLNDIKVYNAKLFGIGITVYTIVQFVAYKIFVK